MPPFAQRLIAWQRRAGRHELPWQDDNPYHVWLSEIMLQQTQVTTVIPYYLRFTARFPNVLALANADIDDVLALWSGLGYYARARNLHAAAQTIRDNFHGEFPRTRTELETLKGVGRSTAAAIGVFAYGQKEAICDGNVKRVLARHQGLNQDLSKQSEQTALWALCESLLPETPADLRSYTQGLMDLGSMVCTRTRPDCPKCPVKDDCYANLHDAQHSLPVKKVKKAKPVKDGWFLLLHTPDKCIYLEKRADKGIWGGLWSLPWFATKAELLAAAKPFTASITPTKADLFAEDVPVIRHQFTHYTLNMYVIEAQVNDDFRGECYAASEWQTLGLATPIRQILDNFSVRSRDKS